MSAYAKHERRKIRAFLVSIGSSLLLVAGFLAFTHWSTAQANTPDINNVHTRYPAMVGTRIDSCSLCHTSSIPSLNPFGSAYKSNGRSLAALAAIEGLDSDGDGSTNLQEITALTFPGDASDKPAVPTATPTRTPTQPPTNTPTNTPTSVPTNTPTSLPSNTPTGVPTNTPTGVPSDTPTGQPTNMPTATATPPTQPATPTSTLPTPTPGMTASPTPTCQPDRDGDDDDRGDKSSINKKKDDKNHCDDDKDKDKHHEKKKDKGKDKPRKPRHHGQIDGFDLAFSGYEMRLPAERWL